MLLLWYIKNNKINITYNYYINLRTYRLKYCYIYDVYLPIYLFILN